MSLHAQPSFPLALDMDPSAEQLAQHDAWWRANSTVWHILWGRLGPAPEALVPLCCDPFGNVTVSSCDLYAILVARYGGGDHGTVSEVKDKLRALHCGMGKDAVPSFVTTWRGALHQLDNTPWNFTEFECIRTFVDRLLLTEAFRTLREQADHGFSSIPPVFLAFENLAIEVLTIDTQHRCLTALCAASSALPCRTMTTSSSATASSTTAPTSTDTGRGNCPFCSNCKTLGHIVDNCWESGGGNVGGHDQYLATHPHLLNHPCANLAADTVLMPDPDPFSDPPISDAFIAPQAPVTSDAVESTLLDFYTECPSEFVGIAPIVDDLPPYLEFLCSMELVALASFASCFNAILDSGCTTHIIRDWSCFWTYDASLTTPDGTANDGMLTTLACGEVCFCILLDSIEHTVSLCDCLHASDVPINLLSVGAMQEKQLILVFGPGKLTTIHLPSTMVGRSGLSIEATFICRLSFLKCDFISPPSTSGLSLVSVARPTTPSPNDIPDVFLPQVPTDLDLWHRQTSHLGMEATKALLTKPYATGITYDGDLTQHRCIPCLIEKHPQQPFSHHCHWATKICELIHMDTCRSFSIETPFGTSMFLILLDDFLNFGHTDLMAKKSDTFQCYLAVEAHCYGTAI